MDNLNINSGSFKTDVEDRIKGIRSDIRNANKTSRLNKIDEKIQELKSEIDEQASGLSRVHRKFYGKTIEEISDKLENLSVEISQKLKVCRDIKEKETVVKTPIFTDELEDEKEIILNEYKQIQHKLDALKKLYGEEFVDGIFGTLQELVNDQIKQKDSWVLREGLCPEINSSQEELKKHFLKQIPEEKKEEVFDALKEDESFAAFKIITELDSSLLRIQMSKKFSSDGLKQIRETTETIKNALDQLQAVPPEGSERIREESTIEERKVDHGSYTKIESEEFIEKNVYQMLDILKNLKTEESRKEVFDQLHLALSYIEGNREALLATAVENGGTLYLRPEDYLEEDAGKVDKSIKDDVKEAKYIGSHIQVNVDDAGNSQIYLIPKHPELYLGSGTFKIVRTGIELRGGKLPPRLVACASVGARGVEEFDLYKEAFREVELINRAQEVVGGEKVKIMYFERKDVDSKAKTIMPYANKGDLIDYINDGELANDLEKLTPVEKNAFMMDLAMGLIESLNVQHKAGVVNRDIKLDNILLHITEDGKIEFIVMDLGFAYQVDGPLPEYLDGTIENMSPEQYSVRTVNSEFVASDGKKADIFSAGIALKGIVTTELPNVVAHAYKEIEMGEEERYFINNFLFINFWANETVENDFDILIQMMVHPEPSKRPSLEEVFNALSDLNEHDDKLESKGVLKDWKIAIEEEQNKLKEYLNFLYPKSGESPFIPCDQKEGEAYCMNLFDQEDFTYILLTPKDRTGFEHDTLFFRNKRAENGINTISISSIPVGTEEDMVSNLRFHTFEENDLYVQYSLDERNFIAYEKVETSDGTVSYIGHPLI